MTQEQKQYIEKHSDLIENGDWEIFFQNAPRGIGEVLYAAGIDFMSHLREIPEQSFWKSNIKDIDIPNSVTSIGDSAFRWCYSLESVAFGKNSQLMSIGKHAFYVCESLKSVAIPERVTSIGASAFADCLSLESITIPDSVTSIEESAFHNCPSLTSVTIPDSIKSIGAFAFAYCSSLKNITIPDSVTRINNDAFIDLGTDVVINFDGTKEQWKNIYSSEAFRNTYFTVNCLDGALHKKQR